METKTSFSLQYWHRISRKEIIIFCVLFCAAFALDQYVKFLMLGGFEWESEALSIGGRALVYNKGVAFSMLSFLEEYLKYIQIVFLLALMIGSMLSDFFTRHFIPLSVLIGAGFSNIVDRFVHGGVVDYVYWHYWFDFAIFNLADVLIDISVGVMIIQMIWGRKNTRNDESKPILKTLKTNSHCCG